jgi:hypothetical protein
MKLKPMKYIFFNIETLYRVLHAVREMEKQGIYL